MTTNEPEIRALTFDEIDIVSGGSFEDTARQVKSKKDHAEYLVVNLNEALISNY